MTFDDSVRWFIFAAWVLTPPSEGRFDTFTVAMELKRQLVPAINVAWRAVA